MKRNNLQGQVVALETEKLHLENEIERLINIINEKNKEIEDYSNKWCKLAKAKTKSDNIINELEKWLESYIKLFDETDMLEEQTCEDLKEVLNKLQELKGSNK